MGGKRKKLSKKIIIRQRIFYFIVTILIVILGFNIFKIIDRKNSNSYRNIYSKRLSSAKIKEIENQLDIQELDYKWKGYLRKGNNPKKIIIHHTASSNITPEQINKMHINNGWSGIGYHFYVRKDGTIYRGRKENVMGSHAKGSNKDTIGICLEGNFEEEGLSIDQLNAIIELGTYISLKYDINDILGHRDVVETLCPGSMLPFDTIKDGIIESIKSIE